MDFLKYIHVRADSPHFKMPWCEGVSPDQQRTILAYGALALSTFPEDFTMDVSQPLSAHCCRALGTGR